MWMVQMEDKAFEASEAERMKARPKHEWGNCDSEWGNCDPEYPKYFGPATETPHICRGPRRHLAKLHICDKCGARGHRILPLPGSKAGRSLQKLMDVEKRNRQAQTRARWASMKPEEILAELETAFGYAGADKKAQAAAMRDSINKLQMIGILKSDGTPEVPAVTEYIVRYFGRAF